MRADAVSRLIGWYLVTAANTHALLRPQSRPIPVDGITPEPPALEFASYQDALDWCERERANLVAGVLQAAEVGLAEHAWKLAAAMLGFFNARRYLADWTSTHLAALAAAQSIGDLVGEAWMWNNLGFVYFYWEETEHKALESFERSLELRVRLGDRLGEAIALNNISGAQYRLGDHAEAIGTLDKAMRIREELGDMMGVGMAYLNIGTVYSDNNQNAQAQQYLLRALKIVDELGAQQCKLKTLEHARLRLRGDRRDRRRQETPVRGSRTRPRTARGGRRGERAAEARAAARRGRRPEHRDRLLAAGAGALRAVQRPRGRERARGVGGRGQVSGRTRCSLRAEPKGLPGQRRLPTLEAWRYAMIAPAASRSGET